MAYHKQKIHIEKPLLESSNSDLLMNKSSKSSQREENLDSSKNELIQDKSEIKENKLRNLDWEDEIEIERSNVRISFLTQNQRATFIKENEEQSGLLEYSIENSHIGMLAQGNRLSTIKNQNSQNLEKIEKLRQLLSRKKNLENEILNILC